MKKKIMLSSAILSFAIILGACGGSSSSSSADMNYKSGAVGAYSDGAYEEAAVEPMYDELDAEAVRSADSTAGGSGSRIEGEVTEGLDVAAVDLSNEKLVYTAHLSVETVEYDKSREDFKALMDKYGAIIQNESENADAVLNSGAFTGNDDAFKMGERHYNVTVRVPSTNFGSFLNGMKGIGVTTSMSSDVQNLTQEYSDITAILEADEEEIKQLKEWLKECQNAEDMTTLYSRITEVQAEINRYKSRLRSINTDVAYSTVSITLDEVIQYTEAPDPTDEITFGKRIAKATRESLEDFADFLENLLIFVIHILPGLLLLLVIVIIVLLIVKKATRNKKPGKAGKQPPYQGPVMNQGMMQTPNGNQMMGPGMMMPPVQGQGMMQAPVPGQGMAQPSGQAPVPPSAPDQNSDQGSGPVQDNKDADKSGETDGKGTDPAEGK